MLMEGREGHKLLFTLLALVGAVSLVIATRLLLGGPEDTWLCRNGEWVRHGNPSAAKPAEGCGAAEQAKALHPEEIEGVSKITLFYNNSTLQPGNETDCNLMFSVQRAITEPQADEKILARELFNGPNAQERSEGFTSFFSNDAGIVKSVKIANGIAYMDLTDIRQKFSALGANTSCGSASFLSSVRETFKRQFDVKDVYYAINGDPAVFYEWMQIGCSQGDAWCDPAPFTQ